MLLTIPQSFAFQRYPDWPDSSKLGRPLRKLREKGFIVGSVRDYFSLTEFGKQKAIEIEKILKKVHTINQKGKKPFPGRSIDDRLITYLKSSQSYKEFLRNSSTFSISEPEFRNLLRCTLETPLRVLKQNLEYYKKLAQSYDEKQFVENAVN